MSTTRAALRWLGQVVTWLVILGFAAVVVVAVLVPRIGGATPYSVLTGSMRPHLPPGTLVIIKPVDVKDLTVGDVVTYQLESGKPAVVTHRITKISTDLTGSRLFTTKGDANNVADPKPVLPVQIKGRLWYSVPYLGRLGNLITGSDKQIAIYFAAGGLVAYAGYMFAGSVRDRRRAARPQPKHAKQQVKQEEPV